MSEDEQVQQKLDADGVEKLFRLIEKQEQERAKEMSTEQDALAVMWSAYQRLKALGWRDVCYCPKGDSALWYVIEPDSTGIHVAHYSGEWPKGVWWIHSDNDLTPSRPILFRPIQKQ